MIDDAESDRKHLSLLRYALDKEGVPHDRYCIGMPCDDGALDNRLCLVKEEGRKWSVLCINQGKISKKVIHPDIYDAMDDIYWKLLYRDTPFDFQESWEAETGQTL